MIDAQSTVTLHTGSLMPIIGFGTWGIKGNVQEAVVDALKAGYTMIDTSGDYGSQPGIGEVLQKYDVPRESIYIVTKVEETDDSYAATKQNLKELQLDYADLMLIHRPPKTGVGEELWNGLISAQQEGMIRDIGVSNYSEQQIQTLAEITGVLPTVNQVEWSPLGWSQQMSDFCNTNGIVIQAYSPLTHGKRLDNGALALIADKYNKTPAQVLVRWNIQHGWVPLPKSDAQERIRENIEVFDFNITPQDINALDMLNENFSALAEKPIYQLNR